MTIQQATQSAMLAQVRLPSNFTLSAKHAVYALGRYRISQIWPDGIPKGESILTHVAWEIPDGPFEQPYCYWTTSLEDAKKEILRLVDVARKVWFLDTDVSEDDAEFANWVKEETMRFAGSDYVSPVITMSLSN